MQELEIKLQRQGGQTVTSLTSFKFNAANNYGSQPSITFISPKTDGIVIIEPAAGEVKIILCDLL